MRRTESRNHLAVVLSLALVLAAVPLLAGERVTVEHAGFADSGYTVEYVGVTEEGDESKVAFKVRNTGSLPLDAVHLEIEEWHEEGWLRAASSVVLWTALEPGEERLFTRPLRNPVAEAANVYVLRRGEGWDGPAMAPRAPGNGLSEKFAISNCTRYCDRCSDKAGERCIGGVQEVSCSCNDTSASCSYSCFPPPV
jgi:hypothetical protein